MVRWLCCRNSKNFTQAQIAQLVEQRTENPRVAGSIPALGIFLFHFLLSFLVFGGIIFLLLS